MKTLEQVLERCPECGRSMAGLNPAQVVVVVASYAMVSAEADEPARWSRGTVRALHDSCAEPFVNRATGHGDGGYFAQEQG